MASLSMLKSPSFTISLYIHPGVLYLNWDISFLTTAHIKVAYLYIIFYAIIKSMHRTRYENQFSLYYSTVRSRSSRLVINLILYLLIFNFLLIGIINPSLLNPGPNYFKVYYQNVQGSPSIS